MLKTLRENFKHLQWILWLVIAVFVIFVFVDWGMGTTRVGGEAEYAAKTADFQITTGEFQKAYRNAEDRYRQMAKGSLTPEMIQQLNLPGRVLDQMIDQRILRAEAERLKIRVTDDEVKARILGYKGNDGTPLFVKDGVFVGDKPYAAMLANAGLTPDRFEAETRDELLMTKLNGLLTQSVLVTDQEVADAWAGKNVKAKIAYVLVRASTPAGTTLPDAELEAYFKQNAASYKGEVRKAKYLLVDKSKVLATVKVSDADVAAEYNSSIATYSKPEQVRARHILYKGTGPTEEAAKAKAESALRKIQAGGDFAAIAKAESQDTGSGANGGDLPAFGRGEMVPEFEEAAFGAPGKLLIDHVVKSSLGYHVIEVLEKVAPRTEPLFTVSTQIRARLQEKRAGEESKRLAKEIADKLSKTKKPSDDELRRLTGPAVTFNETVFISKQDNDPGVSYNPYFNKELFDLGVDEVSKNVVSTVRGEAIVKCAAVKPAPDFADAKSKVNADLVKKKEAERVENQLKEALKGADSLEQVAEKTGQKVETPDAFGKGEPIPGLGRIRPVSDAAFAANPGEMKGPFVTDAGSVVFRLVEKGTVDQAKFDQEKETERLNLRRSKADKLIQALLAERKLALKIQPNKELLAALRGGA